MANDGIFNLGTLQRAVPPGVTNAVLIDTAFYGGGVQGISVKAIAGGGSMQIFGFTGSPTSSGFGQTLTAAQLSSGFSNLAYWPLDATIAFDGPARFYLSALGATTIAAIVVGRSSGV